ncbi:helix-turn-helix transcriptional regulator [Marinilactibacillus sp. GCM10026970]|uniref:helix-turn-helix transcriptional regulator n=1 Tax=Marinilactibacillus sp. GCM10026970 TaxID=3252642 RepID=UPI003620A4C7
MINSKKNEPEILKNERFNELSFIEQNIDELYSENLELKASKESTINTLQSDFLIELFSGELDSPILHEQLKEIQLDDYFEGGTLALLTIEGITLEETKFTRDNLLTFRSKMLNAIASSKPTLTYKLIPLDFQNFCILFSEKNKVKVAKMLNAIIPSIESQLSRNLTFSVATEVPSINQFKDAFAEVTKMMQDKFKYTNTQLIFPDTEEITDSQLLPYTFEEERKLFNAVIDNDLEKAISYSQSILDHLFRDEQLNSFKITEYKIVLFNTIKRILSHQDQSFHTFYDKNRDLFNQLSTSSIPVIYSTFQKIFKVLFNDCIFSHAITTDPTTLSIIEYIDQNFMKDLSLTDLSIEFELSENYISRLLKKNSDINFKAYITELKIAKSKELLLEGKYNVTEISEMVGYKHVNTFIRTFKKHVGYSPGEFSKVL